MHMPFSCRTGWLIKLSLLTLLTWVLSSCATYDRITFAQKYGKAEPKERLVEHLPADSIDYWHDVKPVIESRCIVCHACYDAPCQLKMTSIEGIERGAHQSKVYNAFRITAADTMRLHEDADTVAQWRDKGYFPVLNEHGDSIEAQQQASLIHRLLTLKQKRPLPDEKYLPTDLDVSLAREEQCSKVEEFEKYEKDHPLWGMPYALPAISDSEHTLITRWIEEGASYIAREPLTPDFQNKIAEWEHFLNGDTLKQRLASRYIYEHLFLAHLHFDDLQDGRATQPKFFKLQRSSTPPSQPVQRIATRRPYDAPGVDRVYYRIVEERESIVAKTHMPYALNQQRMQFWQELFVDAPYEVESLPDYATQSASNPFLTFTDLPIKSRHKFLLDEAKFTISGFIKGPVCRGQTALNVINDNFWIFFINPDYAGHNHDEDFFKQQAENLALPAMKGDTYLPLLNWRSFSKKETQFLQAKVDFLEKQVGNGLKIELDMIWNGSGNNDNAALTITRHFDSATVTKGLVGPEPKTAWVINYHLLERIHYLLVAGYDVYGNLGHQYITRTYMDFLRMEGESSFLFFLPEQAQKRERDYWYQGADASVMQYLSLEREHSIIPNHIAYQTNDEKHELYQMLKQHLNNVLPHEHELSTVKNKLVRKELANLSDIKGLAANQMPEMAIVHIVGDRDKEYFTILRHKAHFNQTSMFKEQQNRNPKEDRISAHPGLIGTYPNAYFEVQKQDIAEFVDAIAAASSPEAYAALVDRFGIRRTNPNFWSYSDRLHKAYKAQQPIKYGLLDYNRLENR